MLYITMFFFFFLLSYITMFNFNFWTLSLEFLLDCFISDTLAENIIHLRWFTTFINPKCTRLMKGSLYYKYKYGFVVWLSEETKPQQPVPACMAVSNRVIIGLYVHAYAYRWHTYILVRASINETRIGAFLTYTLTSLLSPSIHGCYFIIIWCTRAFNKLARKRSSSVTIHRRSSSDT